MNPQELTPKVRLYASDKSWIDGAAISQLKGTSELDGVERVVGFPDLHPGKGGPVGCAILTKDLIYPSFIGNDAGCGIGLWAVDALKRKAKLDKWTEKLTDLDSPWEVDQGFLDGLQIDPNLSLDAIGTVGSGNHFAELQAIERIEDKNAADMLLLYDDRLYVCIHSGSRGHGQTLIKDHVAKHGYGPTKLENAQEYLDQHNKIVHWAKMSRFIIAKRFASSIRTELVNVFTNNCHNSIDTFFGETFIHRKGAADSGYDANPAREPVLIPGSRGSFSYLVQPIGHHEANLNSIAHGAGRKWARSDCKARLSDKYDVESLKQTDLGSRVICEDKDLIYEEAPQAYKKIEVVIQDLVDAGLVKVIAVFRPLITYKVRRDDKD